MSGLNHVIQLLETIFLVKNNCNLKYFENIFLSMSILFTYINFFGNEEQLQVEKNLCTQYIQVNKSCQSGFN